MQVKKIPEDIRSFSEFREHMSETEKELEKCNNKIVIVY